MHIVACAGLVDKKTTCNFYLNSCPHRNSSYGPTKDGESEQQIHVAMFFNLAVIVICKE